MPYLTFVLLLAIATSAFFWLRHIGLRREAYVRTAELPRGLFERLQKRYPELSIKDCQLVAHGLRQFFLAYLKSGRRHVAMPSQVVDDLWHEFILYTKHYQAFCRRGFGGFLHHTPAIALGKRAAGNEGLRRCWWHACREENINPRAALRLPLLFALDAKFGVAGGYRYVPDCGGVQRDQTRGSNSNSNNYCGGDFSDPALDGGLEGFGDFSIEGAESGTTSDSSGSGCGGGGCSSGE